MENYTFPTSIIPNSQADVSLWDYRTDSQVTNHKVILEKNVLNFLLQGQKEVRFSDTSVCINDRQAMLITSGNCLMTERLPDTDGYRCILLFFSDQKVADFLVKHTDLLGSVSEGEKPARQPFFTFQKDEFIYFFAHSLLHYAGGSSDIFQKIIDLKLEEIMLYLVEKHGQPLVHFLQQIVRQSQHSSFRQTIETNLYSHLSVEEIAFLCNMSISTFKRHFADLFQDSPGKWLKTRRLIRAKEMLESGNFAPSDIHTTFGYENLSNFSAAFKNEFGVSPRQLHLI